MKTILTTAAALLTLSATAAFAEGDPAKGEKDWKKCKACHSIVAPDGTVEEKGGKTGPNLFGVVGRTAGTEPEFGKYTDEMVQIGADGLTWTPENLAEYVPDAKEFLREHSGNDKAKTSMTPQRVKNIDDLIAFLDQFHAE